jgi:hypothetical protein
MTFFEFLIVSIKFTAIYAAIAYVYLKILPFGKD